MSCRAARRRMRWSLRPSPPWKNARAPHLVEIMDALGPEDPAEDVVVVASAQVGKSECGVNWFLWIVDHAPGPMIIVLPSHEESSKYVRTKLQPAVDETPQVRRKVMELSSRSERGSTTSAANAWRSRSTPRSRGGA